MFLPGPPVNSHNQDSGNLSGRLHYAQAMANTVTATQVLSTGAAASRVALGSDKTVHLVWRQVITPNYSLRYVSLDGTGDPPPGSTLQPEIVADGSACPVTANSAPALAIAGSQVRLAWGARNTLDDDTDPGWPHAAGPNRSGPVCYASGATGNWSVTGTGRQAQGDRLGLEVAADGTVHLLRGGRAYFEIPPQGGEGKGLDGFSQETLMLERYQTGAGWQAALGNTYPTQDDMEDEPISVLDGDLALDAAGNAILTWIDNEEAWETSTAFRLRTTVISATATVPQITKHYYAPSTGSGRSNGQRTTTRIDGDLRLRISSAIIWAAPAWWSMRVATKSIT